MGSLITSAVPRLRCPEEANIRAPESVLSLHLGFIRAGAELIETNTFGANRLKLAARFLDDDVERINSEGVKIAREARQVSGQQVFIAGAIGPLGDVRDAEEERRALFAEQAELLAARGVDLFFVETFYDLGELETAIDAVRTISSLPVVALLTFDEDGQTLAGVPAREAALRLRELGVDALGANHGAGPQACLAALEGMGADGPPLAALPNLGLAGLAGGRIIFPHATPEYFAEFTAEAGPARRRARRRLLRDDAHRDRRDPLRRGRGAQAARAVPRGRARAGRRRRGRRGGDAAARATCARAPGLCRSSSTRRSEAATPGCSTSRARSRRRASPSTSTSTTTPRRARR